ncbi:MAG: hypothetical protein B7Y99_08695 [Caulobacterales bacterium 32-69-10]|nr:MAG: hypothetical protein B7Y99_08695 [Caulobacterales bacterium 32-69-10]
MIENLLMWIENTAVAVFMRENATAFPLVESIHVLALTLVVGTIGMVDLRLLGVSARNHAITKLTTEILPITWVCFGVAAISGLLLFSSKAVDYGHNFFFLGKMLLIVVAAVNMMVFELITYRSVKNWDSETPTPFAAKLAGGLSLAFWISVVVFGRWIGFTIGGAF